MSSNNEKKPREKKEIKFVHCLLIVLFLVGSLVYGLGIRGFVGQDTFSVIACLLIALSLTVALLCYLGYTWDDLQKSMVSKFSEGVGNYLIMLSIGILIASWIVSGTIPMLIYFGIQLVNPQFLYVIAFIICAIFSVCTGTSWGSAGTVGVVLMGIGVTVGGNLAVLAGAVVAGAIFGDKLSPLSDTTNVAALAAGVPVYDHIAGMAYSTIPAAVCSAIVYAVLGFIFPATATSYDVSAIQESLDGISSAFNFNILLLIPVVIVVLGAVRKWPTVPTMIGSAILAVIFSATLQDFTIGNSVDALINGVDMGMITWVPDAAESTILKVFARGGMLSMIEPVIIGWLIYMFMGLENMFNAKPIFVNSVFTFVRGRVSLIISTMLAALIVLLVTGNGYAGSLISADVFRSKYDEFGIRRRILSRTLEDGTTMFDAMFPWGSTGIYMSTTLGVSTMAYFPFMLLTWFNSVIAIILAITGIGLKEKVKKAKA